MRQLVHRHGGSGGAVVVEILGVDLVVALEVTHIDQVRGEFDQVFQAGARAFQNRLDVLDDGASLRADIGIQHPHGVDLGAHEAVVGAPGAGARNEQKITGTLDVRELAARLRAPFDDGRRHIVFAHGFLSH
ncbi:hypothetical protein D3C87_1327560 [compost metagenome]